MDLVCLVHLHPENLDWISRHHKKFVDFLYIVYHGGRITLTKMSP